MQEQAAQLAQVAASFKLGTEAVARWSAQPRPAARVVESSAAPAANTKRLTAPDQRSAPRPSARAAANDTGPAADRTSDRRSKPERRAPAATNDEWEEF